MLIASGAAYTGHLHLDDSVAWLGSLSALIMLSVATLVEIAAYYIPFIDNLLDLVSAPAAFSAGTILSAAVMADMPPEGEMDGSHLIAGGGVARVTRGLTVVLRAHSTDLSVGLGHLDISTAELGGAALISVCWRLPRRSPRSRWSRCSCCTWRSDCSAGLLRTAKTIGRRT